jgi:hypothetical protein
LCAYCAAADVRELGRQIGEGDERRDTRAAASA